MALSATNEPTMSLMVVQFHYISLYIGKVFIFFVFDEFLSSFTFMVVGQKCQERLRSDTQDKRSSLWMGFSSNDADKMMPIRLSQYGGWLHERHQTLLKCRFTSRSAVPCQRGWLFISLENFVFYFFDSWRDGLAIIGLSSSQISFQVTECPIATWSECLETLWCCLMIIPFLPIGTALIFL